MATEWGKKTAPVQKATQGTYKLGYICLNSLKKFLTVLDIYNNKKKYLFMSYWVSGVRGKNAHLLFFREKRPFLGLFGLLLPYYCPQVGQTWVPLIDLTNTDPYTQKSQTYLLY